MRPEYAEKAGVTGIFRRRLITFAIASLLSAVQLVSSTPVTVFAAGGAPNKLSLNSAVTVVSGTSSPKVGKTTTYDIVYTFTNAGTAEAKSATFSVPVFGSNVTATASSGTTSGSSTVSWAAAGPIAPGGSATITVRLSVTPVDADAGKALALTGTATGSALDASNKSYSTTAAAVSTAAVAANALPVCTASALTTLEDAVASLALGCTDAEGDPLTYSVDVPPSKGSASINVTGTLSFAPSLDQNGSDSLVVAVSDGIGTTSKSISITIPPVNDAPRCAAASLVTDEDVVGSIPLPCFDPEGSALTWSFSRVAKGTAGATPSSLTYTPSSNVNGTDSFTATASDGSLTGSAAISVTINPINDLPTCNPVTINSSEDTAGSATLSCSDVEGGTITYSIQVPPANGTATVTNKGVVTFTPSADWNGTGTVFVAVSDGTGAASIDVAVSIAAVNDAPRCAATRSSQKPSSWRGTRAANTSTSPRSCSPAR